MTFWKRSTMLPPILCRLLARHPGGPPLTAAEIGAVAGLPPHQVDYISHLTDWVGVDLPTAHKFLIGCRVDFENHDQMECVRNYLRSKPTWFFLRKSKDWASFYQPLMRRYIAHIRQLG